MTEQVNLELSTNLFLRCVLKQQTAQHKCDVKLSYNKRPRLRHA